MVLIFITFAGLDSKHEKLPGWIKKVVSFISSITLEIYLVQYVIIDVLRPIGHFPINWIVLTIAIIAAAFVLHKVCELFYAGIDKLIKTEKKGI